jgi:hypothetical protein
MPFVLGQCVQNVIVLGARFSHPLDSLPKNRAPLYALCALGHTNGAPRAAQPSAVIVECASVRNRSERVFILLGTHPGIHGSPRLRLDACKVIG